MRAKRTLGALVPVLAASIFITDAGARPLTETESIQFEEDPSPHAQPAGVKAFVPPPLENGAPVVAPGEAGRGEGPTSRDDSAELAERDLICRYLYDVQGHDYYKCAGITDIAAGSALETDFRKAQGDMGAVRERSRKVRALKADIGGPCPGAVPLKEKISAAALGPLNPNTFAAWFGEEDAKHPDECLEQLVSALCAPRGELAKEKEGGRLFQAKAGRNGVCGPADGPAIPNVGRSVIVGVRTSPPPLRPK